MGRYHPNHTPSHQVFYSLPRKWPINLRKSYGAIERDQIISIHVLEIQLQQTSIIWRKMQKAGLDVYIIKMKTAHLKLLEYLILSTTEY